ncbi:unnamed protein product, partial [Phaeothamnion confervicola]
MASPARGRGRRPVRGRVAAQAAAEATQKNDASAAVFSGAAASCAFANHETCLAAAQAVVRQLDDHLTAVTAQRDDALNQAAWLRLTLDAIWEIGGISQDENVGTRNMLASTTQDLQKAENMVAEVSRRHGRELGALRADHSRQQLQAMGEVAEAKAEIRFLNSALIGLAAESDGSLERAATAIEPLHATLAAAHAYLARQRGLLDDASGRKGAATA